MNTTTVEPPLPLRIYFAGELFSAKHLLGNAALAEAIRERSGGRLLPLLPQDFEQRELSAHAIRDQDIRAVLAATWPSLITTARNWIPAP